MSDSENKKLSELRVVDLRAELEKRGLDRNGVKQVLLERLSKALTEEGLDPETFVFEISDKRKSTQSTEEEKPDKVEEKPEENQPESEKKPEPEEKMEKETKPEESNEAKDNKPNATTESKPNKEEEKRVNEIEEENDGHESPIRLTLEDDDETLHDVENETTAEKSIPEKEKEEKSEDKKSNSSEEATSQPDSKTSEQSTEKPAPSGGESKDGEKEAGDGSSSGKAEDTKLQKKVGAKSNPNVVWISNVAQNTRASELKAALSSCGKVTGAKVVVNARFPGTCCFGYVTMSSVEDVENVIAKLNNTELNGQIIKIDKFDHVRAEQMKQLKAAVSPNKAAQKDDKRSSKSPGRDKKDDKSVKSDDKSDGEKKKEGDNGKDIKKAGSKEPELKDGANNRHSRERVRADSRNGMKSGRSEDGRSRSGTSRERRASRSKDRERRHIRSNSRGRHERDVLTFDKIREERDRQRLREKERMLREETRRRHEEAARQREVERRQRSEAHRLEREKEKLRMEREKIEREKAELVRMERERQRLEREKLALEKMELERTLMRLGEERRAAKRPAPYRREEGFDDRKRPASERHFEEPPPPPRFDPPPSGRPGAGPSGSGGKYENRPYDGRESRGEPRNEPRNEPRGRELPPSRPKDSRYVERDRERDRSPHFRPSVRDDRDRRPLPDGKPDMPISSRDHRYGEPNTGPGRFDRNSSSWTNPPQKPFNSVAPPKPWATKDPWRPDSSVTDRWAGSQNNASLRPFTANSNSNLTPVCPPPPGIKGYPDRSNPNSTGPRNDNRSRDLPASRPKDSRYADREKDHRSPHSRPSVREERDRRPVDTKPVVPMNSRYGGSNDAGTGRPVWAVTNQKFPVPNTNKPWRPNSSIGERWPSGPQGSSSVRPYPGNPQPNMAPVTPVPPGVNRYQDNRYNYNKPTITNSRKY